MEKDFTEWHILKTQLQKMEEYPFFHEREMWLCSMGLNLGHEEDGKGHRFLRPVVVFKKFNASLFWGIPLGSTPRIGSYYYQFSFKGKVETALLLQMRTFDRRRLLRRMGIMEEGKFLEMEGKIAKLFLNRNPSRGRGVSRGAEAQSNFSLTG